MTIQKHVSKKELVTNAYLNALIFFWRYSGTDTEAELRCKTLFEQYADILWEVGDKFEGNDFLSPEDQVYVVDDLDKLYYEIRDIDPSSDTLWLMCPAIDMIDDLEPTAVRTCRR